MNRGNFRKVHTGYRCSRTWKVDEKKRKKKRKKKERQKERKRGGGGLSETAAIYETEWKRVLEGVRRPPPLIPPLNTAISTSQLSIRPFRILKGKFQLVRGPTFSRFRLFIPTRPRTTTQMENNATFCFWQLVLSAEPSLVSSKNYPRALGNFYYDYFLHTMILAMVIFKLTQMRLLIFP